MYLEKEPMTNSPCFEIYYSDGGDFGTHALKLFQEVEVKNFFQGKRMTNIYRLQLTASKC